METRQLGSTKEKVSLLGFGCMRLPLLDNNDAEIDFEKAKGLLYEALENGVNYFDTAYDYHEGASEPFLKKAFQGVPRERYLLATKFPAYLPFKKEEIPQYFERQLKNCGVDYFDFYLVHSLNEENFKRMQRTGLYEYLEQQKKKGAIRHLGFSFHDTPSVLEKICEQYRWDFAQIQLNYYDWMFYKSKEQYEILERWKLPCIVMEPVRGGLLANLGDKANEILQKQLPGKSVASWAMRYAASLPNVLCVLSGMSTAHQLHDNVSTYSPLIPMSDGDKTALQQALEQYKKGFRIPCTACRYCMPCPFGVDIPANFSMYNTCAKDGEMQPFETRYEMMFPVEAKAGQCTNCGVCVPKCPQFIHIPGLLAQIEKGIEPAHMTHVQG